MFVKQSAGECRTLWNKIVLGEKAEHTNFFTWLFFKITELYPVVDIFNICL